MDNKKIIKYPVKDISIFEVDHFLNDNLYFKLKNNFNNFLECDFQSKNFLNKKNSKYCFNSRMAIYHEIKKNFPEVNEIDEMIKSYEFYTFFFKNFFLELLKSKKTNFIQFLRLLKIPKNYSLNDENEFKSELDIHGHEKISHKKGIFRLFDIFYNKIEVTAEYSYILNGGKIVPHTDDVDKIFSLMLYFPEYENDNNQNLKKNEKQIGTVFWKSNEKNFKNIHKEGILQNEFEKNNSEILSLPFVGKKLYGFIKNDVSWHSVKKINLKNDYIRKSININFRFLNN
jgi:hypothetical protein